MHFFKSMSIYTVTSMLNSAIPFLLLPVLTRYLSPADYGVLAVINTIITFAFPLTVLGIGTAIYIEYFKLPREELPTYVSSTLLIPAVSILFNLVVFAALSWTLESSFGIPRLWITAIPLLAALQVIPYITCLLFQVKEQAAQYGKYQILLTLLNFGLSILFVVALRGGWQGRLTGMYLAYLAFSIIGIVVLVRGKYLVRNFNKSYIKNALVIGVPLIPHELGTTVINMSDRLFISKMVGLEATGLYSLGYQMGMAVYIVIGSFNQAWAPYLFRSLNEATEESKRSLVRKSYLVALGFISMVPVLFLVVPVVYRYFIHPQFSSSILFVYWTAIGYIFYGLYILVVNYIYFAKKTHVLIYLAVGNAVGNMLLNYILIASFGAIGAAYATTTSFFLLFIVAWWLSNRLHPMPWLRCFRQPV